MRKVLVLLISSVIASTYCFADNCESIGEQINDISLRMAQIQAEYDASGYGSIENPCSSKSDCSQRGRIARRQRQEIHQQYRPSIVAASRACREGNQTACEDRVQLLEQYRQAIAANKVALDEAHVQMHAFFATARFERKLSLLQRRLDRIQARFDANCPL